MYLWEIQMSKHGINNFVMQLFAKNRKAAVKLGMRKAKENGYEYVETYISFHDKDKGEEIV
jgi:hypothetical protein